LAAAFQALWTNDRTTFHGEHYRVTDACCEPKPMPLMVGAFKPKMLSLTAQYADWWNVSSQGIDSNRRLAAECERACMEVGRDPATLRRTWGGGCACAATKAEARAWAGDRYSANNLDNAGAAGQGGSAGGECFDYVSRM
jgi:alkanesulfonate monooxygenase SsuD/methylene tetrahydromethanopterin reductase-like flavin-dependent oxidoreductase (luciferase family)